MTAIKDLVTDFCEKERPVGVILPPETVLSQAIAATRFYLAYAVGMPFIDPTQDDITVTNLPQVPVVTEDFDLTMSEWGIIRPLFLLYVERETALNLEASRGMGVDVYGRSTSEIQSEIQQYESDMHLKAFCEPVISVD